VPEGDGASKTSCSKAASFVLEGDAGPLPYRGYRLKTIGDASWAPRRHPGAHGPTTAAAAANPTIGNRAERRGRAAASKRQKRLSAGAESSAP